MVETCELLEGCGFFAKYSESKKEECLGFIKEYCIGEKKDECQRKAFKEKNGISPDDNMTPNGYMVVE